jgi:hypothetical protein
MPREGFKGTEFPGMGLTDAADVLREWPMGADKVD